MELNNVMMEIVFQKMAVTVHVNGNVEITF